MKDARRIAIVACIMLVTLRLMIGWQLFYEGMWKIKTLKTPTPWTAAGYLRNSQGPFRTMFRNMAGDPDDLSWIESKPHPSEKKDAKNPRQWVPAVEKKWDAWQKKFARHHRLSDKQKARLDKLINGFDDYQVELAELPPTADFEKLKRYVSYDVEKKRLIVNGILHLTPADRARLEKQFDADLDGIPDDIDVDTKMDDVSKTEPVAAETKPAGLFVQDEADDVTETIAEEVEPATETEGEEVAQDETEVDASTEAEPETEAVEAEVEEATTESAEEKVDTEQAAEVEELTVDEMPDKELSAKEKAIAAQRLIDGDLDGIRNEGDVDYTGGKDENNNGIDDSLAADKEAVYLKALNDVFTKSKKGLGYKEKLRAVVAGNPDWVENPGNQRVGEVKKYKTMLAEYEVALANADQAFEWDHLKHTWGEIQTKRSELVGPVKALDKELKDKATEMLSLKQMGYGPVGEPLTSLRASDLLTIAGLTILGLCLMMGFLTRFSAIMGAIMLFMFYAAMPPWPNVPEAPGPEHSFIVNKNFIEVIALLAIACLPTGRWFGVDGMFSRWRAKRKLAKQATA